jgi:hypothetical protein
MRYELPKGILVRTENAAKPAVQRSAHLSRIIRDLPSVEHSLDYGCGKMRYAEDILETSHRVTLVDSEVQLSRIQKLGSTTSTIRSLTARSNRISAMSTVELAQTRTRFDRAFCLNVLSAIPYAYARKNALSLIRHSLAPNAQCLFVLQYRNSDFTRMTKLSYARPFYDGFLLDSLRGHSFYALIAPDRLVSMLRQGGFDPVDQHLNEGSVYTWAQAKPVSESLSAIYDEQRSFREDASFS